MLESIPAGFLVDSPWLTKHGISRFLTQKYIKSGWLERVARGVFRRPAPRSTDTIDWRTCLLSMQHIMGYQVHVGGMSALSLHGHGHYLRLGGDVPIWVYGLGIPSWLTKLRLSAQLTTRRPSLFSEATLGLSPEQQIYASSSLPWDWPLTISTPERATLEAMDELPGHESFHNLDVVFESLTTLRPRMLAALLKTCKKIKVARLFFVFADRHDHAWRKRLAAGAFNLGSGDRALVKGGRIHPRYRIVVPEAFAKPEGEADDVA